MKYILFLLAVILLMSCSTQKTLTEAKLDSGIKFIKLYNKIESGMNTFHFKVYETKDTTAPVYANIELENTKLEITFSPTNERRLKIIDTINVPCELNTKDPPASFKLANKYSYYKDLQKWDSKNCVNDIMVTKQSLEELDKYNNGKLDNQSIPLQEKVVDDTYLSFTTLKYTSSNDFLQTITIPFKFRIFKKDGKATDVSTGFNAGFAYGCRWSRHEITPIYSRDDHIMVGYDKNDFAWGLGGFGGFTTITLNAENTQNDITEEKTVLGVTIGGLAFIEFNKINVGFGIGADAGLNDSSNWDYQYQPWFGLILGLDLFSE